MEARYSKFLHSGLKIYGIDILHFIVIAFVWGVARFFFSEDWVNLMCSLVTAVCIFYYKRNFTPDFIYFISRRRQYSKIFVKKIEVFPMREK